MKKKMMILSGVAIVLLVFILTYPQHDSVKAEKLKPVKILEIKEEISPITLQYIGNVTSEDLKKIGFKSSGRIEKIYVEKGQYVKAGDPLVSLDISELQYAMDAAKAQVDGALAQYEKALNGATQEEIKKAELNTKKTQDAYEFSLENYQKYTKLYEANAISKHDLDKAKLELDVREAEFNQAKEIEKEVKTGVRKEDRASLLAQAEMAKADYAYRKSMVEDAVMTVDDGGFVVDILYEEGEMVSAGYPVIVLRNEQQIVNVGLTQKDVDKIQLGTECKVAANGVETVGRVTNIGEAPDKETRTYDVEIALSENKYRLGTIVDAAFVIGEGQGVWIPIASIMVNGIDYVFVVDDKEAVKRTVHIEEMKGNMVKVTGLKPKEKLVIEGMKKLNDGDLVMIKN
ncbi:MAG: efflux RND transporter periplasmic adaptor subunit [Bacillota bacterium]